MVSISGMTVSIKTDLWFPITGQQGHGSRNIQHRRGNQNWVFSTDTKELIRVDHTPIVRHTKVREAANPFLDTEYFKQRKFNQGMKKLTGRFKLIWKNQDGCCYHCGMPLDILDEREIFFKAPKSCGGKEEVTNTAYVHADCQRIYLESRSKE